jgi:hypothetical protein
MESVRDSAMIQSPTHRLKRRTTALSPIPGDRSERYLESNKPTISGLPSSEGDDPPSRPPRNAGLLLVIGLLGGLFASGYFSQMLRLSHEDSHRGWVDEIVGRAWRPTERAPTVVSDVIFIRKTIASVVPEYVTVFKHSINDENRICFRVFQLMNERWRGEPFFPQLLNDRDSGAERTFHATDSATTTNHPCGEVLESTKKSHTRSLSFDTAPHECREVSGRRPSCVNELNAPTGYGVFLLDSVDLSNADICPQIRHCIFVGYSISSNGGIRCVVSSGGLPFGLTSVIGNQEDSNDLKYNFWPFKAYAAVAAGTAFIVAGWCLVRGGELWLLSVVGFIVFVAGLALFEYGLSVHCSIVDAPVVAASFHALPVSIQSVSL